MDLHVNKVSFYPNVLDTNAKTFFSFLSGVNCA